MNLVRIGQVVINFDRVHFVRDDGAGPILVEFEEGRSLDVVAGAEPLRAWLASAATVLAMPDPPAEPGP